MRIQYTLNGKRLGDEIRGGESLLDFLRRQGHFGTKRGCEAGDCGSCAVLVDGRAVCSCLMMAGQVHGRAITTIEGLGDPRDPHPLQQAFVDAGAAQCGFCIPGMILSAKALLDAKPDPSRDDVARALEGVLCRCTGYVKPFEAVLDAARRLREGNGAGTGRARGHGKTQKAAGKAARGGARA